MTPRTKLIATVTLLVFLGVLGGADYYYSSDEYAASVSGNNMQNEPEDTQNTTIPAGAVRKMTGPVIADIVKDLSLTSSKSGDLTLLSQVITDGTNIESLAILHEGDRAGSVTWVESGNVKTYFISLKEALLSSFSSEVRDLRDETVQNAGSPVRNILTFFDPSLSEERIVFVRVRERLYEFHLAQGKEETMGTLIDALTNK